MSVAHVAGPVYQGGLTEYSSCRPTKPLIVCAVNKRLSNSAGSTANEATASSGGEFLGGGVVSTTPTNVPLAVQQLPFTDPTTATTNHFVAPLFEAQQKASHKKKRVLQFQNDREKSEAPKPKKKKIEFKA